MRPEALLGLIAAKGVQYPPMPRGGRPYWTAAEAAMAAKGVPRHAFAAALFTFAMDDSVRYQCKHDLLSFCLRERERDPRRWPMTHICLDGEKRKYIELMVDIHLIEDRQRWRFVDAAIYPTLFMTTERIWRRILAPCYEILRHEWFTWHALCLSMMATRARDIDRT